MKVLLPLFRGNAGVVSVPGLSHLQMDFEYSICELKRGKRPPVGNP
jgi:hypothetical protein